MKVAMIGLHKRFCDELFFEKVYGLTLNQEFKKQDLVTLITCNRIEIYIASPNLAERHSEIIEKIRQPFEENIEKRFYTFMGFDVLKHLSQVASGLDSLIYGESDIQNQVKKAYEAMGRHLNADGHFLFQKALHISKKVRHEFDIKPLKSLEDQVCAQIQENLIDSSKRFCFIGNSELNRKIYKKLQLSQNMHVTLVTESPSLEDECFSFAQKISYQELKAQKAFDFVIGASHQRMLVEPPLNHQSLIIDLSRPKILKCPNIPSEYFDLSFFEKNSEVQALKHVMMKLDALDYIHNNAKRLQALRFNSFQASAI
jgi:glutamyl-tRNA reductase